MVRLDRDWSENDDDGGFPFRVRLLKPSKDVSVPKALIILVVSRSGYLTDT